jgi:tRNA pseudouridine38-40 synthase
MIRVALKLAYLGTDFYGFQRQPNLRTVEGELLGALEEVGLISNPGQSNYSIAGRTDRGVHALGNVVSFRTDKMPIINQINDILPLNIRILGSASVPMGFKTRFAHRRHYRYVLCTGPWEEGLEIEKMQQAAHLMEGTHNFLNFSKRNERNPIRKVESVTIKPQNKTIYMVDVVGESFLWNMVRKMVSVLLGVGECEVEVEEVEKFLNPQYSAAITPMPPESLILMDVSYKDVQFKEDEYARLRFLQALSEECLNHQRMVAATEEMIRALNGD